MKLTIVASNRNRLDLNSPSTQWFLKSIQWQNYKDFELLIADGGSSNYNELKEYFEKSHQDIPMRIIQHKIGEPFERALLNNVGIRNSKGEYAMCTDVDMLLSKNFVSTLINNVSENSFIESRTMYWKSKLINKIYSGELDPYGDLDKCKIGRIKQRTTCGGCQCTSVNNWNSLRGYNEAFIGWGSEDYDLLTRAALMRLNIKWLGGSIEDIMLFHQPHAKTEQQVKIDLEHQEKNKVLLKNIKHYSTNINKWGGIAD